MKRTSKLSLAVLCAMSCALFACGGGDAPAVDEDSTSAGQPTDGGGVPGAPANSLPVNDTSFDESQLPAGFPKDLIPAEYVSGTFTVLGQVEGAVFENSTPVDETIEHYTEVLGEPTISVDDDAREKSAQWHTKPWAVGVLGNDSESIVSFTRINE